MSADNHTKLQKKSRDQQAADEIEKWLREQGAVESRTFDEETGRPMRTFTIDLTRERK